MALPRFYLTPDLEKKLTLGEKKGCPLPMLFSSLSGIYLGMHLLNDRNLGPHILPFLRLLCTQEVKSSISQSYKNASGRFTIRLYGGKYDEHEGLRYLSKLLFSCLTSLLHMSTGDTISLYITT